MERFWVKVSRRESGCWEWTASRFPKGYGRFRINGRTLQAHRIAYEMTYGPIPEGDWCVCHRCDNPPCVNPAHLFLGTKSDNALDMIRKGRHWVVNDPARRATGGDAHCARLTAEEVMTIMRLRSLGLSQRAIAARVGCSQSHVGRILNGHHWPELTKAA